tara:strand:- start:9129 stop:9611 length:483 start_codon:yes stop_codon:yes gene_type:complete
VVSAGSDPVETIRRNVQDILFKLRDATMNKKLISQTLQATIFGSTLAIPQFALADETALEEIVVVARRRSENLQEVPISVTVFSASDIEDAGINRPQDFVSLTPNVSMVDTANAGDTQVTIRGQYSTRDAESSFAYVVDGVLITNPNALCWVAARAMTVC